MTNVIMIVILPMFGVNDDDDDMAKFVAGVCNDDDGADVMIREFRANCYHFSPYH